MDNSGTFPEDMANAEKRLAYRARETAHEVLSRMTGLVGVCIQDIHLGYCDMATRLIYAALAFECREAKKKARTRDRMRVVKMLRETAHEIEQSAEGLDDPADRGVAVKGKSP